LNNDKTNNGRPLPPVGTRWKKGISGNPRGRPKKEDSLTSLLRAELEKICPADKEGRSWRELIVRATLQQAMKGMPIAMREVWDRIDGKVPQTDKLELSGPEGKEITITVLYETDKNEKP
jgi:hypothetical protein